ncbi:SMP-30/gluconolactonase/LRE family protein [Microlunatus speluncae]|uniref:SMP-30/gluconolactonase/LRE family protein n=1 Tax=Microlunatus speluncae TaxID=2594267 RepID=UPI0012666DDF|nr:SMP-30/gluconolactonase/LRE family protein [Microlunatus speluncae]
MEPEVVLRWPARCGEGPVWDAKTGTVHWVDILAGQVHSTGWRNGPTRTIGFDGLIGAAAPRASGGFLLATQQGFAGCTATGEIDQELIILDDAHRMNDAKLDRAGRFWAGSTEWSFTPGDGALWRLDPDPATGAWRAETVLDGLTLPNGLDWSPDERTFYLVDSIERVILGYDHDPATGTLSRPRRLIELPDDPDEGLPDGLCVDAAGCLWVALYDAARLDRFAPDGARLLSVPLPVRRPTSCAFVGPRLDRLWITSAREGLPDPTDLDGSNLLLPSPGAVGFSR